MIFLVRHGERADNCIIERNKVTNPYDPHLTPKGCDQAKIAGLTIKKELAASQKIEIISSPFQRCITTAINISEILEKKEITLKTEVCETLYSHLFKTNPLPTLLYNQEPSHKSFQEISILDDQIDGSEIYPETLEDVNTRIVNYTQSILTNLQDDQCVILVTHQRAVKSIIDYFGKSSNNVGYCKTISLKKDTNSNLINSCELTIY